MYSIGHSYSFQLKDRIFYTGEVLESNLTHIQIKTIRGETIVLAKEHILRSTELRDKHEAR